MLLPSSIVLLLAAQVVHSAPRHLQEIIDALSEPVALRMPRTELPPARAVGFMERAWTLWQGKIQTGGKYFSFVKPDFLPDDGPVLQIWYPKGSFGGDGGGGAHFYSTALREQTDGRELMSMLLSYEVAFSPGFDFHWGGKLPGLRGGNPDGCGGGLEADGLHCESTRLMFREGGAGEVYAYIPTTPELCTSGPTVECNPHFGTSLSRGTFVFPSGSWSKIDLFVQLNHPASAHNGIIQVYFNGDLRASHENLQIRASDSIFEGGLWFSSFFGGGNSSWSSPKDQTSYFKNFQQSGSATLSEDWPSPHEEEEGGEPDADPISTEDGSDDTPATTAATSTATSRAAAGSSTAVTPLPAAAASASSSSAVVAGKISGGARTVGRSTAGVTVAVMGIVAWAAAGVCL